MRSHIILSILTLAAAVSSGCDAATQRALAAAASDADGSASNLRADHDTRVRGGEWDYGLTLSFTVTNVGERGLIRISPWVSCSEGEWSRVQNLEFAAGERRQLTYFFHEPSVNSTNLQYGVRVTP